MFHSLRLHLLLGSVIHVSPTIRYELTGMLLNDRKAVAGVANHVTDNTERRQILDNGLLKLILYVHINRQQWKSESETV